ncbi:MAG: ATP-binding protein [Phenylobacterium sp.]|uniref:PAS domain-containing hybrid sensor histidine kinase/response regulator n=1 Tax=Phenylobacterium sp. TaxID=1871053 RepID=UPI00391B771D
MGAGSRSAEGSIQLSSDVLDPSASDFLRRAFSLMVLDFDEALTLVSGACVTREGDGLDLPYRQGSHLEALLGPADRAQVRPLVEAALAGRPGMTKIQAGIHSGARVLRLSTLPRMVGQRQQGLVLTVQDVTTRQSGLTLLKSLGDRLHAILTHAADAIVVIDVDGMIEGANPAAEALTGWREGELIGRPITLLMDEPYRSVHQGQIERYLEHGTSGILNVGPRPLPLRHRDGRIVPIELSVGEAVVAGEKKFIGVCRDITARLEKDEALRTANAELRRKLAELETLSAGLEAQRCALQELARETELAREQAESASQAKSRFVATMSHELRTPLNGVLAVADALARRELAEPDRELVEIIRTSGRGLLSILNEVLDLAKVEAGALLLDPRPFSPKAAVAAVAEVWRFAAEAKGLELRVELKSLPALVNGDGDRLRQVLSNLVNNAIKFTETGRVTLRARRVGRGPKLRFEVADSGPGIDPTQRERLFDPFVQADAGTTRRYGGTGLGLAICRRIVGLMGGRIWVEDGAGGGAVIAFEAPFVAVQAAEPSPVAGEAPPAHPTGDPMILVAEDHPLNRLVASLVLQEAGLRFELVEDGEAAVAAVRSGRFDLVLMDVHMPRLDGLEATRAIRRLPGRAGRLPIIAVTANASPEEAQACREAGMDDVVSKPISAEALLRCIAEHSEPLRLSA